MDIIDFQNPLTVLILAYSAFMLLLVLLPKRTSLTSDSSGDLPVSVIIAFHNEADNLNQLIESLIKQDYDSSLIEFIFVDDHSTDQSVRLIKDQSKGFQAEVKLLRSDANRGKKHALEIGIQSAKNDILIFTDADCVADQNWIRSIVETYQFEKADCVIGLAPLLSYPETLVSYFSEAETFFNHLIAFVSWSIGRPVMSFGRNFSYRKSVFEKIGRFDSIKKSLSGDDDLLLEQLRKLNYKIAFNTKTKVYSRAKVTVTGFIRQKTRHISAARFFSPGYQVIAGFFHFIHIGLMIWLLLDLSLLYVVTKLFVDLLVFWRFQQIFKFNSFFRVFILWELFYWLYILLLGSKGYLTKIRLLRWN